MIQNPKIAGHVLRLGVDCEWMAEDVREYIEELEKQLAERDAALARCVEAIKRMLYHASLGPDEVGNQQWNEDCILLEQSAASIPASAQATAKVLAAARKLAGHIVRPSDFEALREAIREEKETK